MQRARVSSARKPGLLVFQRPQSGNSTDVVVGGYRRECDDLNIRRPVYEKNSKKCPRGDLNPHALYGH